MAGLLPILWSTGTGSEVMQRIAVPMVGGMISSTVLTLLVIPAIYAQVKMRTIRVAARQRDNAVAETADIGFLEASPVRVLRGKSDRWR
jgi:Cu(I)/Ag(I) efflux system membrane protein CusA/SilA